MDFNIVLSSVLAWVASRLSERSTYLGLISLLASLGVTLDPAMAELIITAAAGVVGMILVATKDKIKAKHVVEE